MIRAALPVPRTLILALCLAAFLLVAASPAAWAIRADSVVIPPFDPNATPEQQRKAQEFMYTAISGLESVLQKHASELQTMTQQLKELRLNRPQDPGPGAPDSARKKYAADLAAWEKQYTELTEKRELAQFDLQTHMQDYNQAVQTLAYIQKALHDDALRVINNLKQ